MSTKLNEFPLFSLALLSYQPCHDSEQAANPDSVWNVPYGYICDTTHHYIRLFLVQPPGVKVGWSGHSVLQHHILTGLTWPYVGYTVMLQQSPFTAVSSICQSPSLHLPPCPSAYELLLTWPVVPASSSSGDVFSSSVSFSPRQRGLFSALQIRPSSWLSMPLYVHLLWPLVHLLSGFGDFRCCVFGYDATAGMSLWGFP